MKKLRKKVHQYVAVFEPDPDGGYTVHIPALPGCISEGDTFEQAAENIKEAAALYIEVMAERNQPVPEQGDGVVVAPVQVVA